MNNGTSSENTKVQRFLRLAEVFSMPLTALIDADAYAAETFVDFIKRYGFVDGDGDDEYGELRMVSFTYQQQGPTGPVTRRVDVPWLSLVPLPSLNIAHADFEFEVQVYGAVSKEQNGGDDEQVVQARKQLPKQERVALDRAEHSPDRHPLSVRIARSTPKKTTGNDQKYTEEASTTANMKVQVRMEQSDIPEGIAQMLAMMGQSTSDVPSDLPYIVVGTDQDVLTRAEPNAILKLELRTARGAPFEPAGQRIFFNQDREEVFKLPTRAVRTGDDGTATARVTLVDPPESGSMLKTITAWATVETEKYESVDALGTITIEIRATTE